MSGKKDFKGVLEKKQVPLLVLDQKWHQLFEPAGKPLRIKRAEEKVNKLLVKEGKVNQDIKELTALKQKLMDNIMQNMQGAELETTDDLPEKRLKEDSRLIDDINKKLKDAKDLEATLPEKLEEANENLMIETMQFCYQKMQNNGRKIQEIADWLTEIREKVKDSVIEKESRESMNKQMYSYLHDIFGADVINIFDLKYDEMYAEIKTASKNKPKEGQKNKEQLQ